LFEDRGLQSATSNARQDVLELLELAAAIPMLATNLGPRRALRRIAA
jgi:hypothetical protein